METSRIKENSTFFDTFSKNLIKTEDVADYNSETYNVEKRSVVDFLIHRATTICPRDKLQKELEHV